MKFLRDFVANALIGGFLVLVPVYIAVLLLAKAMKTGAERREAARRYVARSGCRPSTC